MSREESLRYFLKSFPLLNDVAWSAWKRAWDLAYQTGYNRAIDDAVEQLRGASMRSETDLKEAVGKLKI